MSPKRHMSLTARAYLMRAIVALYRPLNYFNKCFATTCIISPATSLYFFLRYLKWWCVLNAEFNSVLSARIKTVFSVFQVIAFEMLPLQIIIVPFMRQIVSEEPLI